MFYVNAVSGEIEPWLALGYTYSADVTECILKLNPRVRGSDSKPWISAEVVFSQQLLPENPQLNGAVGITKGVAAVSAPDAQNVFADSCSRGFYFDSDSPSSLFSKPEVKWAISHLIDRQTISQVIFQPASKPANYPWADDNGWKKRTPEGIVSRYDFSFDPDKANALLDQMGSTREGDVRSLNGKPPQLTVICPMPTAIRCSRSGRRWPMPPSESESRSITRIFPAPPSGISMRWATTTSATIGSAGWTMIRSTSSADSIPRTTSRAAPASIVAATRDRHDSRTPTSIRCLTRWAPSARMTPPRSHSMTRCSISPSRTCRAARVSNRWRRWSITPRIAPAGPRPMGRRRSPASWWGGFLFKVGNLKKA